MPRRIAPFFQQAQTFLTFKVEASRTGALRDKAKAWLKEYLQESGEEDPATGHRRKALPEPVIIDGTKYSGLTLRKNVTKSLDVDKAMDLLESKHLVDRVRKLRPAEYYYDVSEIDVLVQEGLITEEEFDTLIDDDITWALWPDEE
jgi:hypothetical protein